MAAKLSLAHRQAVLAPEHRPLLRDVAARLGLSLHELLDLPEIEFYMAVGRFCVDRQAETTEPEDAGSPRGLGG